MQQCLTASGSGCWRRGVRAHQAAAEGRGPKRGAGESSGWRLACLLGMLLAVVTRLVLPCCMLARAAASLGLPRARPAPGNVASAPAGTDIQSTKCTSSNCVSFFPSPTQEMVEVAQRAAAKLHAALAEALAGQQAQQMSVG